jgi:hypothetical protein
MRENPLRMGRNPTRAHVLFSVDETKALSYSGGQISETEEV